MSVVTLDTILEVERSTSESTEIVPNRRYVYPSGNRSQQSAKLWGFDEREEQTRYERIQKRLIRLEAALFEEFGARINPDSRKCLLCMFVAFPTVRVPIISAQPNGVLLATWRSPGGEELAVRCITPKQIHYSIVSQSPVNGQALDRQWGTYNSPLLFFTETPVARRIAQ